MVFSMQYGVSATAGVLSMMLIVQCTPNRLLDPMDVEQSDTGPMSTTYLTSCLDRRQCSVHLHEYCDLHSQCVCRPHAQYNSERLVCLPCPDVGVACAECCTASGHLCVGGVCVDCYDKGNFFRCWPELANENSTASPPQSHVLYISASQIAVSAALVMGTIALITLLYRICSKPAIRHSGAYAAAGSRATNAHYRGSHQQQQPRQSDGHLQTAFQRLSQRLSLTSMQARILHRLRDQPPKYESPTTYDARIRQQQQQQQLTGDETIADPPAAVGEMQTISLSVPDSTDACREPGWSTYGTSPPCYDNDAYSLSDLPPPYTAENSGPRVENDPYGRRCSGTDTAVGTYPPSITVSVAETAAK